MAIIYSYPRIGTLDLQDLMIISDVQTEGNPTKSVTLSQLTAFIKGTPTGGSGTTNFIPKWTDGPNSILGDSILQEDGASTFITCQGNFQTTGNIDLLGNDIINVEDFKILGDIYDVNGNTGVAGEVLSSLGIGNGVEWTSNGGTVTGTGTTNTLPIWTDGPNGVLGDSVIRYVPSTPKIVIDPADTGNNIYNFGPTAFQAPSPFVAGEGFNFQINTSNGGFYKSGNFRFEKNLAVGRTNDPTGATLDVGTPIDTNPAAWFRNGVVVSNNPGGVTVDNTSVVIGAGNNDIVSGSDNCLAVGNNNQILADSDHSLAVGQGNTMSNADNSIVVGQQNTLTGTRLYSLGFSNDLTCASAFALGGENNVAGTQNNFAIGYNNNIQGSQKNFILGTSNSCGTGGSSYQQSIILGNNCTLGIPSSGSATEFGMVVIGASNAQNYPGTTSGQPFRPKIVLAADVGGGSKDALVISEGVNGIASMLHSDALLEHNFANDAAAAAGGVPVGALYHNAGEVRIRIV